MAWVSDLMDRPPADSPDRDRYDQAIRAATDRCETAGHQPPRPCADCIRAADKDAGNT